jgi:hypothetical protein
MTAHPSDDQRHYDTLSTDTQLIWRLQARRDTEQPQAFLYDAGDTPEDWTTRIDELPGSGLDVYLALDVMMLALLDPAPALRPGMVRTAWAILLNIDPCCSLGQGDAARLERLARQDTGHIMGPETYKDACLEACIEHEERLQHVLRLPGEDALVIHPAASSLPYLQYAVRHGLTLKGASPELQAAVSRFLEANDDPATPHPLKRTQALHCLRLIIRLLYLPQLLPADIDAKVSLGYSAIVWRMAHDLWTGPAEWRADLNLLRTHLKALGRAHDNHREMRPLEPYGPGLNAQHFSTLIEEGLQIYNLLVCSAHIEAPDVDPVVLDLPDTPTARLAARLAHVAVTCVVPRVRWGPRMRTLDARVHNVPTCGQFLALRRHLPEQACNDIVELAEPGARAALLLALSDTPGREVLTACAVGLAQLREATSLGAPIGSMTLEFERTVRALWRSLGCPPCAWLTATHGPTGVEAEAWDEQREALIDAALQGRLTPETPITLLPAPESYAYTAWDNDTPRADTEDQPELPFDDLSLTERLVLKALTGKTLVILGGICKPHAKAALIRNLNLKDVDWIESTEYDNGQQAASRLRDPNIVAAIFALRWAAHAHGSIRDAAWALGIPAVSLPGGYSPRQVLHQLSAQVSGSLVA